MLILNLNLSSLVHGVVEGSTEYVHTFTFAIGGEKYAFICVKY
jgi:hypothetical protein